MSELKTDILLKDVRLSFPTLGQPEYYQGKKQRENDKPRWSATGLLPYGSAQLATVWTMMEELAKQTWGAKYAPIWENIKGDSKLLCLQDGKKKPYEGYQNTWALTAHRQNDKRRPVVLDSDRSPIFTPEGELYPGKAGRIYSGCYVDMHVNFWAQDNSNGKAIRADLLGVQRRRDGDAFAGGMAPSEDAFGDITEGNEAEDLT